jgi:hypothetical protein
MEDFVRKKEKIYSTIIRWIKFGDFTVYKCNEVFLITHSPTPYNANDKFPEVSKSIYWTRLSAPESFIVNTKQAYLGLQSDPDVASPTRHWRGDASRTRIEYNQATRTIQ